MLFGGATGDVRGWAPEKEIVGYREKLEWEARGRGRKSNVPFPEHSINIAAEAVGSGNSARRVASADMLDTLRISLSRRSPRRFRRSQENMTTSTTPMDLAWTMTIFHDGQSAVRSRTVNSRARTHSSLCCFPPPFHLPTPPDQADLLNALSPGQLLCVAYNVCVILSRKPWECTNDESIHDIVALGDALSASAVDGSQAENDRKGWTPRRTNNLRSWGA